ncbi:MULTISPECIES: DUF1048 domain-containing protein [Lactococcus]|uniref:DUF1048 domain-containing protein n=2 Tax=Lactococcus garvieae TaxID=1363 RepID=F9VF86_LACGL|nr:MULTISPECIES: DUF1048 domain-containing protein [Lactococcus]EOT32918.1 hypothetical protein OO3_00105 [Lactococcus garvieae ATCC 49156]EOT92957.1 hypothetical protein I578_00490 [Lactococcus garvieae ATCC 49156]QSQ99853.1 DUF1048 domain-containing protein [Lactococcus garvieae]BAK59018.1 conserved hypothetical protein [Lactococcus garvieae ATCC 49156]BAK60987.1 conserved hypothetical protein [Lactococcus garvieae Lg2]
MKFKEIIEEKKEWYALQNAVKKLPKDYGIVYKEIQRYFFKIGVSDLQVLGELLAIFEEGVKRNQAVLDVTGKDVAAFSDSLLDQEENFDK